MSHTTACPAPNARKGVLPNEPIFRLQPKETPVTYAFENEPISTCENRASADRKHGV